MKSQIRNTLPLISFLGLIAAFVSYKAGVFDNTQAHSTPVEIATDTLSKKDSIKEKPLLMPSSKVMILNEGEAIQQDTAKPEMDSALLKEIHMSSSKSTLIIPPESTPKKEEQKQNDQ